MSRCRQFFAVVVVHAVCGVTTIGLWLGCLLNDIAEVNVTDFAKVPLTVNGLNRGSVGRVGRRWASIICGERLHSGLDDCKTVTDLDLDVCGKLCSERLH